MDPQINSRTFSAKTQFPTTPWIILILSYIIPNIIMRIVLISQYFYSLFLGTQFILDFKQTFPPISEILAIDRIEIIFEHLADLIFVFYLWTLTFDIEFHRLTLLTDQPLFIYISKQFLVFGQILMEDLLAFHKNESINDLNYP